MSQTKPQTPNMVERYDGVYSGFNVEDSTLKPSGLSKLKDYYQQLPEMIESGMLTKVGLTSNGHVAYRNEITDRIVYYRVMVRSNEIEPVYPMGRDTNDKEPHCGFGDRWYLTP